MATTLSARVSIMNEAGQKSQLRGELRFQEPLARYTSWRVGGPADRFFHPADKDDLILFLRGLKSGEPLFWLGLGSNVLVRDGGMRGTVIYTRGRLKAIQLATSQSVFAEAGVPCAHVARYCADRSLAGAEFLAGIPGTLGGALAMNAGAFGGETWDLVQTVTTIDRQGLKRQRTPDEFEIGYRHVKGARDEWFLSATLRLSPGTSHLSQERIRALLAQRAATQPTQLPSCGSVFRNPLGDHAARLIDASELKGYTIGGASVSDKHANFIVNNGNATASDIEELIHFVISEVSRKHKVLLKTEVCIVGDEARKG